MRAEDVDLGAIRLAPRFGVPQEKADGSIKVRPVDHFSWSAAQGSKKRSRAEAKEPSINGHTMCPEQMRHDHLDDLANAARMWKQVSGKVRW